jgi:hypothetical protein
MVSSYQFFHVEVYGRVGSKNGKPTMKRGSKASGGGHKWSIREVLDEAERVPGACGHVDRPEPPVHLHGMQPREFLSYVTDTAAKAVDPIGRRMRMDCVVALAGVASFPIPANDIRHDDEAMEDYKKWEDTLLKFLKIEYGDFLRCALRHTDEEYYHVHFYVAEDLTADNRFGVLKIHPGRRASAETEKKGGGTKAIGDAHRKAMEALQDRYYQHVSALCEHERAGPLLQRLSRYEWRRKEIRDAYLKQIEADFLKMKKKLEMELLTLETKTKAGYAFEAEQMRREHAKQIAELMKTIERFKARDAEHEARHRRNEERLQRVEEEKVQMALEIARLRADVGEKGGMSM